jgi:putative peptide zinc metalloprotease protein
MSVATVKLRSDLLIRRHGEAEQSFFVIKDPEADRFFRFGEAEHFIAQQLDGTTELETVRQRVAERFGASPSLETLQHFVERLRGLGLATEDGAQPRGPSGPRRRMAGDLFYFRFKAFDPDRLFDWLEPVVRPFFTRSFLVISAAMIVCALGVTIGQWAQMSHELRGLLRFESIVLAWIVCLVVIVAHEFAHGLTCRHFGGRVREMGFLLIYFQPAFYCNVSDAWLFAKKADRLWVTFAGAYFELFLWALATVFWRLTEPGTPLNYLALVVAATSAIKSFFNMNPLIKLDGYYLLSDALDLPNLRQKAFSVLRRQFASLVTFTRLPLDQTTPRERRIYVIYGLLAGVYSIWLLGLILSHVGRYLVGHYQAWGFAIFSLLFLGLFRHPLRHAGAQVSAELSLARERRWRSLKRLAKTIVLLGAVGAALWYWHPELKVAGEFAILPIHNADARTEVSGIIQEIFHEEGDQVKRGDVIARLADRDYLAELRKTSAEIAEKHARLKMLKIGPRAEEIDLAKTQIAKAAERIKYARIVSEMNESLFTDRLVSRKELEGGIELLNVRDKELQEANERLKFLLAGSRPEEIEALEAELARLRTQESYLEGQLSLLSIVSSADGIVTTHRLKEKLGQYAAKGDLIAQVQDLTTITAEILISEKEIADVKLGQKVVLKVRAHPNLDFPGTVDAIAPVASKTNDWRNERTFMITTRIENRALLLRPDMTGLAKIYCGEQRAVALLGRRIMRYVRIDVWSWW